MTPKLHLQLMRFDGAAGNKGCLQIDKCMQAAKTSEQGIGQEAHLQLGHLDERAGVGHAGRAHHSQHMLPHQLQSLLAVDALCQGLQVGLVLSDVVHPAATTTGGHDQSP